MTQSDTNINNNIGMQQGPRPRARLVVRVLKHDGRGRGHGHAALGDAAAAVFARLTQLAAAVDSPAGGEGSAGGSASRGCEEGK